MTDIKELIELLNNKEIKLLISKKPKKVRKVTRSCNPKPRYKLKRL